VKWARSSDLQHRKRSDTPLVEAGRTWPRCYTRTELKTIAAAAGPIALQKIQRAVEAYQWASLTEPSGPFFRSNKERREQLNNIVKLIDAKAPASKIESALKELDGTTWKLLDPVDAGNPRRLRTVISIAIKKIPRSGRHRERARLQYIGDLARIYSYATGRRPTRIVHDRETGPFREFVIAALTPFNAAQGCEADIKKVLRQHRKHRDKRKKPASAKR
jgi:hypothetical protein